MMVWSACAYVCLLCSCGMNPCIGHIMLLACMSMGGTSPSVQKPDLFIMDGGTKSIGACEVPALPPWTPKTALDDMMSEESVDCSSSSCCYSVHVTNGDERAYASYGGRPAPVCLP